MHEIDRHKRRCRRHARRGRIHEARKEAHESVADIVLREGAALPALRVRALALLLALHQVERRHQHQTVRVQSAAERLVEAALYGGERSKRREKGERE